VAAGCGLGLFVSDQMLSFLNATETGERVEPPFILETRWFIVGAGIGAVAAIFGLALWLVARVVARAPDVAALRTE
jgi:hypothetical protein